MLGHLTDEQGTRVEGGREETDKVGGGTTGGA